MNVVFLDYDGVVNTPIWSSDGSECRFNHPEDNKVNNFQAVQWLSKFCIKYNYSIVVTSTWRRHSNYKECLINGGLNQGIDILGKTPHFDDCSRHTEIETYLTAHPEIDKYIIIDDDGDMGNLSNYLVKCDTVVGFTLNEFKLAENIHNILWNRK